MTTSEERDYTGLTTQTFKQRCNAADFVINQAALQCSPAFNDGKQIPSKHVFVEARLGPQGSTRRLQYPVERAAESQR